MLEVDLFPFIDSKFGKNEEMPIFQQEGAASHTSKYTAEWLMEVDLPVLD